MYSIQPHAHAASSAQVTVLQLPDGWEHSKLSITRSVAVGTTGWSAMPPPPKAAGKFGCLCEQVACRKLRTGSGRQVRQPSESCVVPAQAARGHGWIPHTHLCTRQFLKPCP